MSTATAASDVLVPDIGDFDDVPVIEVLVSPGDTVAAEDPLVTLESDKATMDVPSPMEGVVAGDQGERRRQGVRGHAAAHARRARRRPSEEQATESLAEPAAEEPAPAEESADEPPAAPAVAARAPTTAAPPYASPGHAPPRPRARRRPRAGHGLGRKGRITGDDVRASKEGPRRAGRRAVAAATAGSSCCRGRRSTSPSTARSSASRCRGSRRSPARTSRATG